MKKLLFLFVLLGTVASVQAQQRAMVGLTAAYARTQLMSSSDAYRAKNHSAYQAGLMADVYFSSAFSFHPELLYTMQYYDYNDDAHPELNRDLTYLNLPLLARYHVGGLFFEAGPQLNLPLTVKNEDSDNVKDEVHNLSLDYVVGLGYQFHHGPSLGVRYDGGATNIFKNYDSSIISTGHLKTSTFLLVLGYSFGHS